MSAVKAARVHTCPVLETPTDWVALSPEFTPGWPWPEDSYGLGPMYGDDGWCRGCGTPLVEQSGCLVIQGRKFPSADVWMPNWLFDVVCVSAVVAAEINERFVVELGDVHKPRQGPTGVKQLRPSQTIESWHPPQALAEAVRTRHGHHSGDQTGASCDRCGCWKWLPVSEDEASIRAMALQSTADVIASPEVFGDGLQSFRHVLFRRRLGEVLVRASPRHWSIVEVQVT